MPPLVEDWIVHVAEIWSLAGHGLKKVVHIMIKSGLPESCYGIDCSQQSQRSVTFSLFTPHEKNFIFDLNSPDDFK